MTIITRTLATLLATAVIAFGSLAGCTAQGDNLMPCALDPANAARFTCGDTDYTVLDDAASAEEIGTRIGALHVNAAVDAQGRTSRNRALPTRSSST
ncbi:NisI/SpaI family lantibiotic immunity lipoprotein [Eggerthella sinensis]|uniref:NisI/SpaI family lantibiotic immunity lipoprotein n=1 Tax=Eggerthella sinensis TaxID=242230 RepID=UPI001D06BDA3|nr:NisI/SpaI family lantibiotic immunity lipoprotein [Eggerthella sinensis]MCB7037611.1 NisI/SpaI family lantibiotic immunity lipoprotein [Eggerthella sinensis]